jgi:hypothetical protein
MIGAICCIAWVKISVLFQGVAVIVLFCCLFNYSLSIPDYVASNYRMVRE